MVPPLCQLNHISFEFAVYAGAHSCRQTPVISNHGKIASVYLHSPGGHTFASNIVKVVLQELQTCIFHKLRLFVQSLLSLLSPLATQSDFNWVSKQSQTVVGKHKHGDECRLLVHHPACSKANPNQNTKCNNNKYKYNRNATADPN